MAVGPHLHHGRCLSRCGPDCRDAGADFPSRRAQRWSRPLRRVCRPAWPPWAPPLRTACHPRSAVPRPRPPVAGEPAAVKSIARGISCHTGTMCFPDRPSLVALHAEPRARDLRFQEPHRPRKRDGKPGWKAFRGAAHDGRAHGRQDREQVSGSSSNRRHGFMQARRFVGARHCRGQPDSSGCPLPGDQLVQQVHHRACPVSARSCSERPVPFAARCRGRRASCAGKRPRPSDPCVWCLGRSGTVHAAAGRLSRAPRDIALGRSLDTGACGTASPWQPVPQFRAARGRCSSQTPWSPKIGRQIIPVKAVVLHGSLQAVHLPFRQMLASHRDGRPKQRKDRDGKIVRGGDPAGRFGRHPEHPRPKNESPATRAGLGIMGRSGVRDPGPRTCS